jgi:Na+-driven multidrug efflux pump
MAGLLGLSLAAALTLGRSSIPGIFSRDSHVLQLISALLPFVIISQPINAMAFVWDGVLFGAGGFRWVAPAAGLVAGCNFSC